jgi:excisionase family DNA binding protein
MQLLGSRISRLALSGTALTRVAGSACRVADTGACPWLLLLQIRSPLPRSSAMSGAVRVEPRADDREVAGRLAEATLVSGAGLAELRLPDGSIVGLSESLLQILQASAGELAEGHSVTVMSSEVALSPAEAADLLGLSRPFVVRLLDDEAIPSQHLPQSRHRKVLLSDVLSFQERRARMRDGHRKILEIVEADGLPY